MAIGFRIAARTLRHLGSELITSDDIALNELGDAANLLI